MPQRPGGSWLNNLILYIPIRGPFSYYSLAAKSGTCTSFALDQNSCILKGLTVYSALPKPILGGSFAAEYTNN